MNPTRRTFIGTLLSLVVWPWRPPAPTGLDLLVEGRDYFVGGNVDCDVSDISGDQWISLPGGEWRVVHIEC